MSKKFLIILNNLQSSKSELEVFSLSDRFERKRFLDRIIALKGPFETQEEKRAANILLESGDTSMFKRSWSGLNITGIFKELEVYLGSDGTEPIK